MQDTILLYYRGSKGQLHAFADECPAVPTVGEVETCRKALISELMDDYGNYNKPVLALIQGGKA